MLRIISVEAMDEYLLRICLNNGNALILNLQSKMNAIRFKQLNDKELFKRASTDGHCIRWNELIELSITEVFEIIDKEKI